MTTRSRRLFLELLEGRDSPAVFTVSTTADSGAGSFRQAILNANANPGTDTIQFQIGTGTQTIKPATALPDVTSAVVIDGTSQPGYAGTPLIVLDGSATPTGASGIVLANHTGSTVRGLEIVNFSKNFTGSFIDAAGINIRNGGGHTIQGDYIGTDGTNADPNGYAGILVNNSTNNLIGGTTAAARNVIAGNRNVGVYIVNPGAAGNQVQGNYIGTDASGTHGVPNGSTTSSIGGVVIAGFAANGIAPNGHNTIGGVAAGAGNIIAFERYAVQVVGSYGNSILGNSMHDDGAGILLDGSSTPNASGGALTGANNDAYQPTITGLTRVMGANGKVVNTTVNGSLSSTPNTQFRIEIFGSNGTTVDAWGSGQGTALLGSTTVTTDASGNATFSFLAPPLSGVSVVATATNLTTGDTSPFSPPQFSPVIDPAPPTAARYAVGAATGEPRVWVYNADGTLYRTFDAYSSTFLGGVHVAMGDVNGDGVPDIITGAGPGGGPHVKVFDGVTGVLLTEFFAYDVTFTGGVNVAAADVNGDGHADVITGAGPGGGPHVKIFDVTTGQVLGSYFAYASTFTGGVSVAAGDIDGDGKADVITGAGAGGGPHLKVFHDATSQLLRETFPYDASFTGGLSLAAGDFNGDGKTDIAVGPLTGGPARIRVLNSALAPIKDIEVYQDDYRGGTSLAMHDIDGSGLAAVLVTINAGGTPEVFGFQSAGTAAQIVTLDPAAPGGIFIG
jgi:hypothetical protein